MKKMLLLLSLLAVSSFFSCATRSLTQLGNTHYRFYWHPYQISTEVEKCDVSADGKTIVCKEVEITYE